MLRRKYLPMLMCLAVLAGCDHQEYRIDMTPQGNRIQRTLTVGHKDGQPVTFEQKDGQPTTRATSQPLPTGSQEELDRMVAIYGPARPSETPGQGVFQKTFQDVLPDDVGGRGYYWHIDTSMGSTSGYMERFRGTDDIVDEIHQRQQSVDRMADLLGGWVDQQLKGKKEAQKVRDFINKDLRKDARNLVLYMWVGNNVSRLVLLPAAANNAIAATTRPAGPPVASGPAASEPAATSQPAKESTALSAELLWMDLGARFSLYLMERGYGTATELYDLVLRRADQNEEEQLATASDLITRIVTRKAGLSDPATIEAVRAMIRDWDATTASVREYLRPGDEYKALLKKWREDPKKAPDAAEPDPLEVVKNLVEGALPLELGLDPFGTDDVVTVTLAARGEWIQTDGQWDAQANKVTWTFHLTPRSQPQRLLPAVCYAVWTEANRKFQEQHFGKTVLEGSNLMSYAAWRKGLSPREAAEWDAFIASLKPGADLAGRLESFQFTRKAEGPATPAASQPAGASPDVPLKLIRQGLGLDEKGPQGQKGGGTAGPPAKDF